MPGERTECDEKGGEGMPHAAAGWTEEGQLHSGRVVSQENHGTGKDGTG